MDFEELEESSDQIPNQPPVHIATPERLGSSSVFFTSRPESGLRDVLTVECHKINGEDFKGSITYTEATVKIFQQELGLSAEILHSVNMSFGKFRTVSFKLKKQINIDEMHEKERFELKRSYMKDNLITTDVINCKIAGIRKPRTSPDVRRPQYDGSDVDIQLVEISGCQYSITKGELLCWLNLYGEVLSDITEMTHPDSVNAEAVGNGTYVVKMKLSKPIPQFLPVSGRKIRFYYNGIRRMCTNCYGYTFKLKSKKLFLSDGN